MMSAHLEADSREEHAREFDHIALAVEAVEIHVENARRLLEVGILVVPRPESGGGDPVARRQDGVDFPFVAPEGFAGEVVEAPEERLEVGRVLFGEFERHDVVVLEPERAGDIVPQPHQGQQVVANRTPNGFVRLPHAAPEAGVAALLECAAHFVARQLAAVHTRTVGSEGLDDPAREPRHGFDLARIDLIAEIGVVQQIELAPLERVEPVVRFAPAANSGKVFPAGVDGLEPDLEFGVAGKRLRAGPRWWPSSRRDSRPATGRAIWCSCAARKERKSVMNVWNPRL